MAISDNPTTRDALRRAVLGDLVDRCTAAAVSIEGGALDGIEVSVRLPALDGALTVTLSARVECSFWQRVGSSHKAGLTTHGWSPEQRAAQGDRARALGARRKEAREAAAQ